jgi:DNA processing protein
MKSWISLNMTPFVGPRVATRLLERFGSPEAVFGATRNELESMRLKSETVDSIIRKEFHGRAGEEVEQVLALGGDILTLDDGDFPELLREIADPPIVLYLSGEWKECLTAPCVGVVGSRRCSTYGENAAEMLARDLAAAGVTVVSGLARGIDTAAHRGAVAAGGRTVAVLGTGIDGMYPRENARLARDIVESGGALVTQFPLGTPPLKDNFPYRNRIISGLSHGVLLVEATERSGSLITARLAMEQNREVMAVPGNITSRNSMGTNYLIKSGAKLVQHWQDVVAELPREIAAALLPPLLEERETGRPAPGAGTAVSREAAKVLRQLSPDSEKGIDELVDETGLGMAELSAALVDLELAGLVRAHPGMRYSVSLPSSRPS